MIYVSICDDDVIIARKIKKLIEYELSKKGIEFHCNIYISGRRFLEYNKEFKNELIILDIEMPDISGIKIAEYLKKEGRNKNIVFITSYDNLVFRSLECYPYAYIRKKNVEKEIPKII